MKVRTQDLSGGLVAHFVYREPVEIHYDELEKGDGQVAFILPPGKSCNMVTGIDGGYVMGKAKHPNWNIIAKRVKGTGKYFQKQHGYIISEKFGKLVAWSPSFGQNEKLEFDVHEHEGKRRAINVTGPGGTPLKGQKTAKRSKQAKKVKTGKKNRNS